MVCSVDFFIQNSCKAARDSFPRHQLIRFFCGLLPHDKKALFVRFATHPRRLSCNVVVTVGSTILPQYFLSALTSTKPLNANIYTSFFPLRWMKVKKIHNDLFLSSSYHHTYKGGHFRTDSATHFLIWYMQTVQSHTVYACSYILTKHFLILRASTSVDWEISCSRKRPIERFWDSKLKCFLSDTF